MLLLANWEGFSEGSTSLDKSVGPQAKTEKKKKKLFYSAGRIWLFNTKVNEMADLLNYFSYHLFNLKMHEKFNTTNSKNDLNVCSVNA